MSKYQLHKLKNNIYVVCEAGRDYMHPAKASTFAFDTENIVLLDDKQVPQNEIFEALKDVEQEEKRRRLSSVVWAWQCYDEINGFFMTNDFDTWLTYQCRAGYNFGWCYNAKFDFSQIDYKILAEFQDKWKPYVKGKNKNQPYAYSSLHNDMGARYSYKLWYPYKKGTTRKDDRHTRVHSIQYYDFMNLVMGGLAKVLESLDVRDNEGNAIRKLAMDYQAVEIDKLSEYELDYCCVDVKGLYFAVKQFNAEIENYTGGECHIWGESVNIMTAGGLAKRLLLQYMYPYEESHRDRVKKYQKQHPVTLEQDKYVRKYGLYRGGICLVNEKYRGKLIQETMYRYDVNSEYPYAMSQLRDLVGVPFEVPYDEYLKMKDKEDYECIMQLDSISGELKKGYIGFWFDIYRHTYTDYIDESGRHLIFKRELDEMSNFYNISYTCEKVILIKRGRYVYRDFIDDFYKLKNQAKKEGNKVRQSLAKLILNSSYGKLAERVERRNGKYELNEETGAIHFVETGVEVDESSMLSVLNGALVTSFARCYILSKIRETCKEEKMIDNFIYIDTDSIHSLSKYDNADPYSLGGLKLEAECVACKYLAPKSYIDIEEIKNGIVTKYEAHTKGINVRAVNEQLASKVNLDLNFVDNIFNYGKQFVVLCAMNVKGGKVLIPTKKYLAREELAPQEVITSQLGETLINER